MERQFQINWAAIVEEARQRRKAQRLTQRQVALLAGVSTPTLSRFENGEKDLQLSSIMGILTVLGMVDHRNLVFSETKGRYNIDRNAVLFSGKDGEKVVSCAIGGEALTDHFSGHEANLLKSFAENRERIEHETRKKYIVGALEPDGSIFIRTTDI